MDDGQVLTALAKNVKNLKTFNPKQDMEVTHWYLNKQDATKSIYHNGDRNIDEATTVNRLQVIIEGFHRKFISSNQDESIPTAMRIEKLKAEIDGMALDLSDVVFGGNQKNDQKLTTTPAQPLQNMTEEETDRLVRSFKEIIDFASKNNREPQETKENIEERKLWSRLNGIRGDEDKKAILKPYDTLGLLEGTFKPQVQEESKEDERGQATDYTITLPAGSEKYITAIKGAFAEDSELRDISVSFNVGGVVMDAIEKSQIAIEGESSKIKTKMVQTIYFASIGYDKIEGKENAKMPSVSLIKNAEYIKEKTGVDYAINHHQRATFETTKIEVDFDGQKAYSLFLPIGKFENWSVKERWLSSSMNRKRTIEYILEQLKDEAKGNVPATKTEEPKTESEIKSKLEAIKPFMGEAQYSILNGAINNPDNEFKDVINELYQTITTMPKTYEQDGMGDKAVAYLHYFKGGNDWWITEKDTGDQQDQAFGLASINGYEPELGYISIVELTENDIELDFYWEPKTVGEIKGEDMEKEEEDTEMGVENEYPAKEEPKSGQENTDFTSRLAEFKTLTIKDMDRAEEIMVELTGLMEKEPENKTLEEAYNEINEYLNTLVG